MGQKNALIVIELLSIFSFRISGRNLRYCRFFFYKYCPSAKIILEIPKMLSSRSKREDDDDDEHHFTTRRKEERKEKKVGGTPYYIIIHTFEST